MSVEEKRLAEALEQEVANDLRGEKAVAYEDDLNAPPSRGTKVNEPQVGFCQWSAMANEQYRPSGPREETLAPGVYEVGSDPSGLYFQRIRVVSDDLIEIDKEVGDRVLGSMRKFWASKNEYVKRGILYKRGILLWGPAGSGKTSIIALLMKELIKNGGLVILCRLASLTSYAISVFRRIEPDRNIIVIAEDIDEIVQHQGEHALLALLDGENQVENVVNVATTNYPERLGARIINRPSRFDERILVDMPNVEGRRRYLHHITRTENMPGEMLERWVEDTEGFSVAHLRELAVAVFCLQQEYETTLDRLKSMQFQLKALPEFKRMSGGFENPAQPMQAGARAR